MLDKQTEVSKNLMFNEEYLHAFIRSLSKTLGEDSFAPSSYTADDSLALRSRLIKPLEPNPTTNHNLEIASLVALVRSLLNHRNQDGEHLAGCYLQALKILDKVNPPNAKEEPETYFTIANGELLYEISKLMESPLNIASARLYGVHPVDYLKTTDSDSGVEIWAA